MDDNLLKLLLAIIGLIDGYLALMAKKNHDTGARNSKDILGVHVLINSQLEAWKRELLESTARSVDAAFMKGVAKGEADERLRSAQSKANPATQANTAAMDANTAALAANTRAQSS